MSVERRLAKLEAGIDPSGMGFHHMTDDELQMRLLDVSREILAGDDATLEERALATSSVARVEASIRAQAVQRRTPGYAKHLARVQGTRASYVPAVCDVYGNGNGMAEYGDLHRPRIMERRAAILARPDVQALLADVDAAVGPA